MARLVECKRRRRAGTCGNHTRRTVRAHDRNVLWTRAARTHRPQGHAVSTTTVAERPGVQRCDRVPFAAACATAHDLWHTNTYCAYARLSGYVPTALSPGAGPAKLITVPRWSRLVLSDIG